MVVVGSSPGGVTEAGVEAASLPGHGYGAGGRGPVVEENCSCDCGADRTQASTGGRGALGVQLEGEVVLVGTLAGDRGREMYCHRSQAWLGFWNTWSCSKGWSGTWGGRRGRPWRR